MTLRHLLGGLVAAVALAALAAPAQAFCGFYVAKADTGLFNKASKVVIARNGPRTVITMVNDYLGDPKEFAIVVPVPEIMKREQIHVTEGAIVEHLDAYTAPRLVEYFDDDPCMRRYMMEKSTTAGAAQSSPAAEDTARALGVTIEAQYTVGEYDIVILSAEQSNGLQTWLTANGYRVPVKAGPVLDHYLANGMKFFVARVNLTEKTRLGYTMLRPLQLAFESDAFMLPIRLGMINADGAQDLFVFTLTRNGRVETANYRTVRVPSGQEVPLYVKDEFGSFYNSMFDRLVAREDGRAVFLEYAWDMAWCDPCAADPLSVAELQELGVHWLRDDMTVLRPDIMPPPKRRARDVFVTRLHVRYDAEHFPDDLMFRETVDRTNIQGRYVLRHPWRGRPACVEARRYFDGLPRQFSRQAEALAHLTGWPISEIRGRMASTGQAIDGGPFDPAPTPPGPWWRSLWPKG